MKNSKTFAALAAAIMAVSSFGVVAFADAATDSAAAPVATESTAPAETPAESTADAPAESVAPAESQAEESKAEESKAEESAAPAESKAEESKAEESKAEESKADDSKAEESKAEESKTESKATESKKEETSSKAEVKEVKRLYDAFTGNEFTYDANGNFVAAYRADGTQQTDTFPKGILYGFAGEDKAAGDIVFYDASNGLKVVKTVVRSSVTGDVAEFAKTTINDLNKTTGTASKTDSKKDTKSSSSSKADDKKKDNPKTGNAAANSLVSLVTLAGAAAVAVVSRKKKD